MLQQLRAHGLAGGAPLLALVTALGREALEAQWPAQCEAFDDFLVKPLTPAMLLSAATLASAPASARHGGPRPGPWPTPAGAPGGRLAGLRLLVAEDNPNNQQVVRELLEDEGAWVRIVGDGQEAVTAVAAASPSFDAVLMDLQMPVMDGLAATRQIRLGPGGHRLPIIAMTANAAPADRQACLAAGMDEHVGKPFELDAVVLQLQRLVGRPLGADGAEGSPPAAGAGEAGPLAATPGPARVAACASAAGVDLERALSRLGGKAPVYERMLRTFVHDLARMPAQLKARLEAGDTEAAARLLHTLKGLAATVGAAALAAAAESAQRAIAMAATPAAARAAAGPADVAMRQAAAPLLALLQALQDHNDGPTRSASAADRAPKPADTVAALQELAALLENSDMRATDLMPRLLPPPGSAPGGHWQALDEAVAGLEFERALPLCRELLAEALA
jgi:CheY-like chemotaxis protein